MVQTLQARLSQEQTTTRMTEAHAVGPLAAALIEFADLACCPRASSVGGSRGSPFSCHHQLAPPSLGAALPSPTAAAGARPTRISSRSTASLGGGFGSISSSLSVRADGRVHHMQRPTTASPDRGTGTRKSGTWSKTRHTAPQTGTKFRCRPRQKGRVAQGAGHCRHQQQQLQVITPPRPPKHQHTKTPNTKHQTPSVNRQDAASFSQITTNKWVSAQTTGLRAQTTEVNRCARSCMH
jgi:hypothetical protein